MAQAFVDDLTPYINDAIQRATLEGQGFALRMSNAIVAETIQAAKRATSQQLVQLADALERGVDPRALLQMYESLGQRAQAAVLASFDATKGRSTSNPALNRASRSVKYQRYAGGRLRAALASSEFWSATSAGLDFINVGLLNERAAQWARVNFGAGAIGRGSRPNRSVYLGAMLIASLGLEEEARPAFVLPTGYFTDSSGKPVRERTSGAAFFVYKTGPYRRGTEGGGATYRDGDQVRRLPIVRQQTVGVAGRQFLDAGVTSISRNLGPALQNLYRGYFQQAETSVRPYRLVARVTPQR